MTGMETESQKRRKILFAITKTVGGGAQRYVFDVATNLPSWQYEISLMGGGRDWLAEQFEKRGLPFFGIEGIGRDIHWQKELKTLRQIFKVIKGEKPDIIHVNSPKMAGLAALAGRILHVKKIVLTVHGWTFNERRPFFEKAAIAFFSWFTAVLAHHIILITKSDYEDAKKFPFISRNKFTLIPNGLGDIAFLEKEEARSEIRTYCVNSPSSTALGASQWVGMVAELTPNKNIPLAIRAFARIPPSGVSLIILGKGEEEDTLKKLIHILKLEDRVLLAGFLPEPRRLMKAFDIFCLSSFKEGLPYVIMEAMRAEVPVLATSVGGVPDLIENGTTGRLTTPGDEKEFAEALLDFIHHLEERRILGRRGNQFILSHFSLQNMLSQTMRLYEGSNF